MAALLDDLVAVPELQLRLLVPAIAPVPLSWAHGTDLDDPTPFLESGQLLLTTGRQFGDGDPADIRRYVERVLAAGVAAIGFGTEVLREGTPVELTHACRELGMPLVEVPYDTPFIAVSRWIAERHAAESRERLARALANQTSVSAAAVGTGGLGAALARGAESLACEIVLLDPDAEPVASTPGDGVLPPAELAEARRLLRAGRRASATLDAADGHALVRTLGASRRLRGVLLFRRGRPFDDEELSLVTTVVALAEVSLEHRHDARESVRALLRELLALLEDGRVDAVRAALARLPAGLPARRLRVLTALVEELPAGVADSIERRAADPRNHTFHARRDGRLVLLIDERRWARWHARLADAGIRAGISEVVEWRLLPSALTQSERALDVAAPGALVQFADLVGSSVLGLLSASAVTDVARARLEPLAARADGGELLDAAEIWLRHNTHWDAAARELGIHRHSLKHRMRVLGEVLDLDLDRFAGRAELWALLAARRPVR